ncbi:MAG: hypothetical protein J5597_00430 [Spirochaetaceae bacterium]|nr:hypothetical protein [Spirochaetaceae bacterium]
MFCKNYGKEIEDGVKFCPECGASQKADYSKEIVTTDSSDTFNFHNWIVENGLESYEDILKSEDFDTEDILIGLTNRDIERLNLPSVGANKKVLNAIQKLKSSGDTYNSKRELAGKDSIPNRCPECGAIWGMAKENSGAGNTLGKALIGGLLLGPIGAIGGAAFGNKTTVYICNKCGFKKEYKSSLVKGFATSVRNAFK